MPDKRNIPGRANIVRKLFSLQATISLVAATQVLLGTNLLALAQDDAQNVQRYVPVQQSGEQKSSTISDKLSDKSGIGAKSWSGTPRYEPVAEETTASPKVANLPVTNQSAATTDSASVLAPPKEVAVPAEPNESEKSTGANADAATAPATINDSASQVSKETGTMDGASGNTSAAAAANGAVAETASTNTSTSTSTSEAANEKTQASAKREDSKETPKAAVESTTKGKNQQSELAMIGAEVSTTVLESKNEEQDASSKKESSAENEPMFIDNDEAKETTQTFEYTEPATDETGTKLKVGATFPVVISSELTSKSAQKGDPIEARLKYDLKIGDRMIAEKGSVVIGHINYALKARSTMHSLVSPERWYRNSGCLGLSFDEIVNGKGEHIPLAAAPARKARIVRNKAEGRELGVNQYGQVTGPWSQQLRYKAIRIGLNAAMAPAGAFSFGAMPVALGVMGAVNPSFAFMKPVGQNVRHRSVLGVFGVFLSGVPGSWLVEDTVVKGQEAVIKPGDEFLAAFKEEFTGEPVDASQNQGTSSKVNGEVIPRKKTRKS